MDKACVANSGVVVTPPVTTVAVTPIPEPITEEVDEDNSLETAELILICLGGAIVVITILLVSFMCYDKYCNTKRKHGNIKFYYECFIPGLISKPTDMLCYQEVSTPLMKLIRDGNIVSFLN